MNSFTVSFGLSLILLTASACGSPAAGSQDQVGASHRWPQGSKLKSPGTDDHFHLLPNGKDLRTIKVSSSRLSFTKGAGRTFSSSSVRAYENLIDDTLREPAHKVQWTLMNLDNGQIVGQSLSSNRKVFGASSSKIFVGATLLDKLNGSISSSQLQLMADMLVVSSNSAWTTLQTQMGNGSSNRGREANYAFTQRMGYPLTRGFQGYWGNFHGNEITARETAQFLYDTYNNNFPGAEILWKIMHTCRTGASRGLKYLPSSLYVGGKTGTYSGPTENPETGSTKNPDGSNYTVKIRNHVLVFNKNGTQYGLVILSNDGSDESVALLAGGLYREITN